MVKGAEEDKPGLNESPFCAVEVTLAYVVTSRSFIADCNNSLYFLFLLFSLCKHRIIYYVPAVYYLNRMNSGTSKNRWKDVEEQVR